MKNLKIKIVPIEDKEATNFCWLSHQDNKLHHLYATKAQVNMCFPFGYKDEEDLGRGQLIAIKVEGV